MTTRRMVRERHIAVEPSSGHRVFSPERDAAALRTNVSEGDRRIGEGR